MTTSTIPHPFDPITPGEIQLAVRILKAGFPGVPLRFKRIDIQEPIKNDVVPYIEAERLRQPLPPRPARILLAYFHRLDNGAFYKTLLNADTRSIIHAKEIPREVQVSFTYHIVSLCYVLMVSSHLLISMNWPTLKSYA